MGLGPDIARTLMALRRSALFPDRAHIVEIGAQQLSNIFFRDRLGWVSELYSVLGRQRPDLGMPIDVGRAGGFESMSGEAPPSRPFWESLGCSYTAIEYGGHCGAISLDLNRDSVPDSLRGSADLVVNAGTTEHVMNQANAFEVIHDLCKPGAVMYHAIPCTGLLTHGLVQYTPKFFWTLCRFNNYEVIDLTVLYCGDSWTSIDIIDSNEKYGLFGQGAMSNKIPVMMLVAALKKIADRPFVCPLDLPA